MSESPLLTKEIVTRLINLEGSMEMPIVVQTKKGFAIPQSIYTMEVDGQKVVIMKVE